MTRHFAVFTSFIAVLGFAGGAAAQFSFDTPVNLGTGQRPDDVAAGDFDGDGDLDLAVTTDGNGNQDLIELYFNDGLGNYSPGGAVFLPNSSSPGDLEAADLDGDGDIDLAVVLRDFNQVQSVINNGGSFSTGATVAVGINAGGMSQRDMEGDGDIDLIIANRDSNTATVLSNNSNATFAAATLAVGDEPRWATFIDINGDANIDAAVTNHRDRTVSLFTNTGAGFTPAGTLSTGGDLRPEGITAADLNGDGLEDLASGTGDPERASVWLNTGGAFGARADYPTGGIATSEILAADFDCDGDIDLATINQDSNNVSILPNTGAGAFGAATILSVGTRPGNFTAADMDGDGDDDLFVANRDSNNVSILENMTCEPVDIALLQSVTVTTGTLLSGGVADLIASDDSYVRTRSGFGSSLVDLHKMEMIVGALSDVASPTTLSLSVESRIDQPSGNGTVYFRNWTSGNFEPVGQHVLGSTDASAQFPGIAAASYVDGAGQIDLRIRHVVFVPFLAFTFESFIDQVEITVE